MRLVVNGCAGRMGKTLLKLIHEHPECVLQGGLEAPNTPHIGQNIGDFIGVKLPHMIVSDDVDMLLRNVDGIIDFATPHATCRLLDVSASVGLTHVIGTTGFTRQQEEMIESVAQRTKIIKSGNMSLGINLLAKFVQQAAKALDVNWDIEIVEMHHRDKRDAPSGTALLLAHAATQGRGIDLAENMVCHRQGLTQKREENKIGFASLRGGSVVGDHDVIFAGDKERLVLRHVAESRDVFARGAIQAALWGYNQDFGLYSMSDVLGF